MNISTSICGVHHPNAGQNIQHAKFKFDLSLLFSENLKRDLRRNFGMVLVEMIIQALPWNQAVILVNSVNLTKLLNSRFILCTV